MKKVPSVCICIVTSSCTAEALFAAASFALLRRCRAYHAAGTSASAAMATMTGDGRRLSNREVKLLIKFHQWITDGAGARANHWRTSACSPRDCAHFTPQLKRVRQLILTLLGMHFVRFGSFPGFKGEVVNKLVADVQAGTHPVVSNMKQLKDRTGITGRNPFHSKDTPMDAVRNNPGP